MDIMILAIVFIIYIFALVYVGYYAWKETESSEDFMIGGKDTNPAIMALSYGATFISTAAIIGFGGVAGEYGMSVLWLAFLNIIPNITIIVKSTTIILSICLSFSLFFQSINLFLIFPINSILSNILKILLICY